MAAASNLLQPESSYLRAIKPHEDADEDAMHRFGNGRRHWDWLGTAAVLGCGAGLLLAGYLLAGLAGLLN